MILKNLSAVFSLIRSFGRLEQLLSTRLARLLHQLGKFSIPRDRGVRGVLRQQIVWMIKLLDASLIKNQDFVIVDNRRQPMGDSQYGAILELLLLATPSHTKQPCLMISAICNLVSRNLN